MSAGLDVKTRSSILSDSGCVVSLTMLCNPNLLIISISLLCLLAVSGLVL